MFYSCSSLGRCFLSVCGHCLGIISILHCITDQHLVSCLHLIFATRLLVLIREVIYQAFKASFHFHQGAPIGMLGDDVPIWTFYFVVASAVVFMSLLHAEDNVE